MIINVACVQYADVYTVCFIWLGVDKRELRAYSSTHATPMRKCIGAGRNGIRFDLNSANRGIDFTAFKHPLAKRQSLGVVPARIRVCARGRPARSDKLADGYVDEKDDKNSDDDDDDDDVYNIQRSLSTMRP